MDEAPYVVGAIVVLVVGYIVARLAARLLTIVSQRLRLQVAAEQSGLAESMQHMGIKRDVPAIVGTIVFWLLMCLFVMAAFNILGLAALTATMGVVASYIPKVLVAIVVVVVGLLLATFLRGIVATSTDRLGVSYAEHLANACYYALAALTFFWAFKELGIKFELLNYAILIAIAALALAFGLAFGLGGREVMAGILAGYYLRQRLNAGDHVQVGRPGRHGPRGRPRGHHRRDPRRRPHQPPHGAQHQDAQRGGPLRGLLPPKTPPPQGGLHRPEISNGLGAISLSPLSLWERGRGWIAKNRVF